MAFPTRFRLLHFAGLWLTACGGAASGNPPSGGVTCTYNGQTYAPGDSFPAADGCNSCGCNEDGRVACTLIGCDTCESVAQDYAAAFDHAAACDPKGAEQCTLSIAEGLACNCPAFVNPDNADAISAAQAKQLLYTKMSCGQGIQCGACAEPTLGYCSAQGRCESLGDGSEPACKVAGVVYKSGSSGIPDPISCNQCSCQAGQLNCTEIGCSKPCPADTTYAEQCAQCGPTAACLIVEHACLPTCSDSCQQGLCIDGVCRNVCG